MGHLRQSATETAHDISPLDRVGWLANQSDAFRRWAASNGRWRRLDPGKALYFADDLPNGLYGLGHGSLEIAYPLDGIGLVPVHRAAPGFWIGEAASLAAERRMVGVTAVTECLVYHLPDVAIARLIEDDPAAWRAFYQQSNANIRMAVQLLAEGLALPPRIRFARLLLRAADQDGDVHGSEETLGRLAGIPGSSVKRIVAGLVAAGAVASGYGRLTVRDRADLERIAWGT